MGTGYEASRVDVSIYDGMTSAGASYLYLAITRMSFDYDDVIVYSVNRVPSTSDAYYALAGL